MNIEQDLGTTGGLQELLGLVKKRLKANVEQDGYLWPIALVIVRKNPENGMFFGKPVAIPAQPHAFDDKSRDLFFGNVKRFAAEMNSPGVIFACMAVGNGVVRPDQQSLVGEPGINSRIYVMAEHVTGTQVWEAPISVDIGGQSHVGSFERMEQRRSLGMGLLPPQSWLN